LDLGELITTTTTRRTTRVSFRGAFGSKMKIENTEKSKTCLKTMGSDALWLGRYTRGLA